MARKTPQRRILVINGPNLGMLGFRQPEIYGTQTLNDIVQSLQTLAAAESFQIEAFQSNSEGALLDFLNQRFLEHTKKTILCQGIIINPAAFSHTSVALRDAVEVFTLGKVPVVEVHLSNVFRREEFRKHSFISEIATAVISGLQANGYLAALQFIISKDQGGNLGGLK